MALVKWMVGNNPPIMWGFLGRIKIMKAYFIKGTWTLCGMGEGGLWRGQKWIVDPLYSKYYDSRLDVTKRIILGKKCVHVTSKWKEKNTQMKCVLIIAMENGWCVLMVLCWCLLFYLEYDDNIRIVIHISRII